MSRRRALMAAQETESALTLHDLTAGVKIRFGTATNDFIYLGELYGNALVMKDVLSKTSKMLSSNTYPADYDGTLVDEYMENTYVPAWSQQAQDKMIASSISCVTYSGSASGTKTISRKGFVLSEAEVTNTVLAALKTYNNTSDANTARIAKDGNGTAQKWWLRDAKTSGTTASMKSVGTTGAVATQGMNAGSTYVRQVVSFKPGTVVKQGDGFYYVVI